MAVQIDNRLIVAISSRALFDLSESHAVYEAGGVEAYQQHQVLHEDELLAPGVAFELTRKLLRLNETGHQHVEVVLLSRNSADTGLRVFNAISHYKLGITRAVFTSGRDTSRYVPALGTHLFLSADPEDVRHALESGMRQQPSCRGLGMIVRAAHPRQLMTSFALRSTVTLCFFLTKQSGYFNRRGWTHSARRRRVQPVHHWVAGRSKTFSQRCTESRPIFRAISNRFAPRSSLHVLLRRMSA